MIYPTITLDKHQAILKLNDTDTNEVMLETIFPNKFYACQLFISLLDALVGNFWDGYDTAMEETEGNPT